MVLQLSRLINLIKVINKSFKLINFLTKTKKIVDLSIGNFGESNFFNSLLKLFIKCNKFNLRFFNKLILVDDLTNSKYGRISSRIAKYKTKSTFEYVSCMTNGLMIESIKFRNKLELFNKNSFLRKIC